MKFSIKYLYLLKKSLVETSFFLQWNTFYAQPFFSTLKYRPNIAILLFATILITPKKVTDISGWLIFEIFTENVYVLNMLKAHSEVWDNLATESPLKMIKNSFYFILKALSFYIFKFLSRFFGHVKKSLIKR